MHVDHVCTPSKPDMHKGVLLGLCNMFEILPISHATEFPFEFKILDLPEDDPKWRLLCVSIKHEKHSYQIGIYDTRFVLRFVGYIC